MAIRPATPKFKVGDNIRYRNTTGFRRSFHEWEIMKLDHVMQRYRLQRFDDSGKRHSRWLDFNDQYPYRKVFNGYPA